MIHRLISTNEHNGCAQVDLECREPSVVVGAHTSNGWGVQRIVLNHKIVVFETNTPDAGFSLEACNFMWAMTPGDKLCFYLHSDGATGPAELLVHTVETDTGAGLPIVKKLGPMRIVGPPAGKIIEHGSPPPAPTPSRRDSVARKMRYGAIKKVKA